MKEPSAGGHDEERTALVPSSALPTCSNDGEGAAPPDCKRRDDDDDSTGSMHGSGSPDRKGAVLGKAMGVARLLRPTRGVGLVISGLVVLALLVGTSGSGWTRLSSYSSFLLGSSSAGHRRGRPPHHTPSSVESRIPIPFSCGNETSPALPTCPRAAASSPSPSPSPEAAVPWPPSEPQRTSSATTCPEYFRYIHSDLSPWREAGITLEAVERAQAKATFRLVVVGGRAYVEKYRPAYQTRDVFTLWGILQLLARYPGRVPDLDLMFFCGDIPEVRAAAYPDPSTAPPLFMYCTDDGALDIAFPDWTFWGWPEVNIRPWAPFLEEVARESRRVPWPDRLPYAFWKGNPSVSRLRGDLMRCNATADGKDDWNARVFRQDWGYASRNGFRDSNLAKQCTYRYKIYAQGRGWSVSQKYIMACGSPMLRIDTPFRDFLSRGLVAGRHYWPIDAARICPAIKFAVDWGNAHPAQAQRMGEEGGRYTRDDLSMDYVYDYMLHLLTQYARLLRYRPAVPEKAVELCLESMACPARGRNREFMMESMEKYVADYEPCTLPPPFTAQEATELAKREDEVRSDMKKMEEQAAEKET